MNLKKKNSCSLVLPNRTRMPNIEAEIHKKKERYIKHTYRFFLNCVYVTLVTISVYFINTAWALSKFHSVSLQALHSESALQAFKVQIQFQKTFEINNFGPKNKLVQIFLKTLDPSDWLPTRAVDRILKSRIKSDFKKSDKIGFKKSDKIGFIRFFNR